MISFDLYYCGKFNHLLHSTVSFDPLSRKTFVNILKALIAFTIHVPVPYRILLKWCCSATLPVCNSCILCLQIHSLIEKCVLKEFEAHETRVRCMQLLKPGKLPVPTGRVVDPDPDLIRFSDFVDPDPGARKWRNISGKMHFLVVF
jgi:hypothetical protein